MSVAVPKDVANAPSTIIVQQGRLLDFIDGVTQRSETPEEYVRQEIAKSLVREYSYAKSDISVEYTLRLGSRRPRADLAIFLAGERHTQENVDMIVECKAANVKSEDRREGVGQLKSYLAACPNARYGMWTNGSERFCYRRVIRGGKILEEPVADIPTYGQIEDSTERPKFEQLKPASSDALLFAFRRCHNYIAGNQGLQKPEAFWELLKLIFCKIYDERDSELVQFFTTSAERGSLNGEIKVKSRLDKLFAVVRSDYPQIFKSSEEIELTPPVLSYIVTQLQIYSLLDSDIDVKGKAYEEIVGSNLRGDRGEFFTPRNICRMAVAMLDPDERQLIVDPACGTGGFLTVAMNHVVSKIHQQELSKWGQEVRAEKAAAQRIERFLIHNLVGIDLNPNLVKAAKMNMVMNNDGAGGLFQANTLASAATWPTGLRERDIAGQVDIIVTNPPFGSKIPIDTPAILEAYDLGHSWTYDDERDKWVKTEGIQKSQPPEILFIERCVKLLKPGSGRAAMVLPDGILGSPGLGYVRQWLLEHTYILASVDMHPDTFQPGTSVQTSLVVVQRKSTLEQTIATARSDPAYDIFMALANHIGHDKRGNSTYVRDQDGNELLEEVEVRIRDSSVGPAAYQTQKTRQKKVDDNTQQIASAFRVWMSSRTS